MTRINANIKPKDLIDQHLIAEYREIVRIPNYVRNNVEKAQISLSRAPKEFKLNSGHVLYFYDKIQFLHARFIALKEEMDHRNISNNISDEMFIDFPVEFYNDIESDNLIEANKEVAQRIVERISTMKKHPTIHGQKINIEEYSHELISKYNE